MNKPKETSNENNNFSDNQLILDLIKIDGNPIKKLPKSLFIPDDFLKVILESFEGPLDLLLYLIRKNKFDILKIPIVEITSQYKMYVREIQRLGLNQISEYLYMAAWLTEIKSRMLLPNPEMDEDEEDPRKEIVNRLLEYKKYVLLAEKLDELILVDRLDSKVNIAVNTTKTMKVNIRIDDLQKAYEGVKTRKKLNRQHQIIENEINIKDKIINILDRLAHKQGTSDFFSLCINKEGKKGLVATFVAVLELIRQSKINAEQDSIFAPLYIKAKS